MGHLETSLERLRPLILGSNSWDYCVVWKLGDEPSRFIEWFGCCCNGGRNQEVGNKRKNREENMSVGNCRDANFVHPANTKSCQALAKLPQFMSLHSGIHGEVVILGQSRWISITNTPDSKASNQDLEGTRLLIPVIGGLVELFSTDNITENEIIMEFVKSQCTCSETETMSNSTITFDGPYLDPLLENTLDTCLSSLNQLSLLKMAQTLNQIAHTHGDSTMGGSSTGSFPSPDSTPCSVSQAIPFTPLKEGSEKVEKKTCKSKNLFTERNRRSRIREGMLKLRSLVPKITKMDKAATLSDAIDYIKELEKETLNLLHELEDSSNSSYDLKPSSLNPEVMETKVLAPLNPKQLTSSPTKYLVSQVQVKVNQLDTGNYLVRVACQQSLGAFTKVLEAVGSLDVLIDDVNSTVYDDTMSSYFIVQTKNKEIQEKDIRDSLMLLFV
ncbi:hypothetical protein KSS87_017515 [Heliosperma pusillum]|nr:hypothetical protein KSS87_020851 [Heliosperma pusillum]KAH9622976.1 hypothetical protein KSS87_017515 [Heliosperma pusillum]